MMLQLQKEITLHCLQKHITRKRFGPKTEHPCNNDVKLFLFNPLLKKAPAKLTLLGLKIRPMSTATGLAIPFPLSKVNL